MKAIYIKTKFNSTINITKIITVHYYEFDQNFSYEGESHNFWEMVYVDKGKVEIATNDETIILGQEEILFHKPNEFHSIKSFNSSPNFFVLSFECNSPQMKNFEHYHTKLNKNLKPIISSIIEETDNTYIIPKNDVNLKQLKLKENLEIGGEQLIKIYLEQLFILMLRKILKNDDTKIFPSKENLENHIVTSIKEFINNKLFENTCIDDICKQLCYGKSYLCKLFHDNTGFSIMNYVNNKKIEYAKQIIRDGEYNISEISSMLSFDSPQYFTRVFKRITNMTPTEFKNLCSFK